MNALLAVLAIALAVTIALLVPGGALAVLFGSMVAFVAGIFIARTKDQRTFLLRVFIAGLLLRVAIGTIIYAFKLQEFFGGDAITYDTLGLYLMQSWHGSLYHKEVVNTWVKEGASGWGMLYVVAAIYTIIGRNMLAVQFFNAVVGAATAPLIFLCARHIFQNLRVARLAAYFVAFFPSLVLWSSQGLKDGPIVFLLVAVMLATLKLGEQLSWKYVIVLVMALFALLSFRFYVFYMTVAAAGGAFLIGMRPQTTRSLARQLVIMVAMGLSLTYLGVLRTAGAQLETYGDLQTIQRSRADQATSADSGFGRDVDVSTTAGALKAIPVGIIYLLFAPFPWQLSSLRQSITLPEMVVWWCSFPLLCMGAWFTVRYRFRQALPILIFTSMLTLAYSIFQGNVGTAYRQRSQILVFYFIFVGVGYILLKERRENRQAHQLRLRQATATANQLARAIQAPAASPLPPWQQPRPAASRRRAQGVIDF